MMKIGLSSWAYRFAAGTRDVKPTHPLTHFDLLERCSALGVQVVQICDNMPLDNLDTASLQRLATEARNRHLTLEVGTVSTRSEHLMRFIEIARILNARILRVAEDMKEWRPTIAEIADELRRVLPACRTYDVTIAVENHFAISTADLARLMQEVNDPRVGICLDTVNSIARLEGWREAVHTLAPYTVSLHLKDAMAERRGVGFYISGRPLGQGMIDFPFVLHEMRRYGRQPNVLLELWMDFIHDEETTLRQEQQWIGDSLTYIRQLVVA